MLLSGIDNVFGTDAFVAPTASNTTVYYKTMKLDRRPARRLPSAPKPLSHHLRNFLLNYNG